MARPNDWQFISQRRLRTGLWASATCPQRCLMLLGVVILILGCYILGCNEDLHYTRDRLVQRAVSELERLPCKLPRRQLDALEPSELVHLDSCPLDGGRLSLGSPDLKVLLPFKACFPEEGVKGAWLRVHVQRFDGAGWNHLGADDVPEGFSPKPAFYVSHDASVGSFRLGTTLAKSVPGTMASLQCSDEVRTSSATWTPQDSMLYSCKPDRPTEGDLRIWFSVGGEPGQRVSVLGSVENRTLVPWRVGQDVVNVRMTMPAIGGLKAGPVSAQKMLQVALPRLQLDVWPMRGIGFLVVWLSLSFLLFPNHCPPCVHHEDGRGCYKSFVLAILPTAATILASQCYLRFALEATVCTVFLLPLLAALAWGCEADLSGCICCCGRRRRQRQSEADEADYVSIRDMESAEAVAAHRWEALREKAIRIVAFSIGLGLAVAGPAVRAFAAIDIFGFYIYAWATTVPNG
mmetsp:Transcript_85857/g.188551  ORF Transcript_85857/g.188551 Transcript_85857/m.188551 type:complete len:462 (+) Transcript_85857:38-1423(+)